MISSFFHKSKFVLFENGRVIFNMILNEHDTPSVLFFIYYIINTIAMDVSTATQKLQLKKLFGSKKKTFKNGQVWFELYFF